MLVLERVKNALVDVDRDGSAERDVDGDGDIDIDIDVVTVVVRDMSELRDMLGDGVGGCERVGLRDGRAVADTFAVSELRILRDCTVDTVAIVEKVLVDDAECEGSALFDGLDCTVDDGISEVPDEAVRDDKSELTVGPSETEDVIVNVS